MRILSDVVNLVMHLVICLLIGILAVQLATPQKGAKGITVTHFEYQDMTYLIVRSLEGMQVVNYTLDSIEKGYHEPCPEEDEPADALTDPGRVQEPSVYTYTNGVWR
jgi:hypothetical protein